MEKKTVKVRVLQKFRWVGRSADRGEILEMLPGMACEFVARKQVEYVGPEDVPAPPVSQAVPSSTRFGPGGVHPDAMPPPKPAKRGRG
jgi:hypothetical protein